VDVTGLTMGNLSLRGMFFAIENFHAFTKIDFYKLIFAEEVRGDNF
jgi:hypothetical protein